MVIRPARIFPTSIYSVYLAKIALTSATNLATRSPHGVPSLVAGSGASVRSNIPSGNGGRRASYFFIKVMMRFTKLPRFLSSSELFRVTKSCHTNWLSDDSGRVESK